MTNKQDGRVDGTMPRITVVMPSFNQAQFLGAAMRSVLNQDYPNLEFILMDGGSTDGSTDIIRSHAEGVTYWQSEPDGGQAAALNKGFAMATGDILCWLNSDDMFLPGALSAVADSFRHGTEFLVGKSVLIDDSGRPYYAVYGLPPSFDSVLFWSTGGFTQPASFWSRRAASMAGQLDERYALAFDAEFFMRLARAVKPSRLNQYLAAFRYHPGSISTRLVARREAEDERFRRELYGLHAHPAWYRKARYAGYQLRYRICAGTFRLLQSAGIEKPPRNCELSAWTDARDPREPGWSKG